MSVFYSGCYSSGGSSFDSEEDGNPKQVFRDCAYQNQLRDGKRIEVKARDLLKRD